MRLLDSGVKVFVIGCLALAFFYTALLVLTVLQRMAFWMVLGVRP